MDDEQRLQRALELDRLCPRLTLEERIKKFGNGPLPNGLDVLNSPEKKTKYSRNRGRPPFSHLSPEIRKEAQRRFNMEIENAKAKGKWPWTWRQRGLAIARASGHAQHPDKYRRFKDIIRRVRHQYAHFRFRDLPKLVEQKVGPGVAQAGHEAGIEGL